MRDGCAEIFILRGNRYQARGLAILPQWQIVGQRYGNSTPPYWCAPVFTGEP